MRHLLASSPIRNGFIKPRALAAPLPLTLSKHRTISQSAALLAKDKDKEKKNVKNSTASSAHDGVGAAIGTEGERPQRAFEFLGFGEERGVKPRSKGITEIRGPYYTALGPRQLTDILEISGEWVDNLKFAGGSFTLLPEASLRELIDIAHRYGVNVSTGGFVERVLAMGGGVKQRRELVDKYLEKCRDVGFDIVELSTGFITLPLEDWARLVDRCHHFGVKPKPEVGIQFGAGGTTEASVLAQEGTRDVEVLLEQARKFLDMGCEMIMIESEGITESVSTPRYNIISKIISELGTKHLMFEAADPEIFTHYIKTYGPEVNLFVDHSQILQLEGLRQGIWGVKDVWGRIVTYK